MPKVQRVTDKNNANAAITSSLQSSVRANGLLIAVDGSPVSGHGPVIHAAPYTANGSPTVKINNIPVTRTGDDDICGHTRIGGSANVNIN
jgi:uncharacterized Zn-binding protein involved in type VI secretion